MEKEIEEEKKSISDLMDYDETLYWEMDEQLYSN